MQLKACVRDAKWRRMACWGLLIAATGWVACGKGNSGDPLGLGPGAGGDGGSSPSLDLGDFEELGSGVAVIVGRVVSGAESTTVAGATVHIVGGDRATTDADGWFTIENVNGRGPVVLIAEHAGLAESIKQVSLESDGFTFVTIEMAPARISAQFDAAVGGEVTDGHGARAAFAPHGLATRDGRVVTGPVEVSLAPLDSALLSQRAAFPGEFTGRRADGNIRLLSGLAPMAIVAKQGSELLTIASGRSATISLPISGGAAANAPTSVPMWTLDPSSGEWREEGSATRVADAAAPGGYVYRTGVSHLSWFNGTQWLPSHCISGHVTGLDNRGASSARVTVSDSTHNATFNTITDDYGRFAMDAPAGTLLHVVATSRTGDGISDDWSFTNDYHEDNIGTHLDPYTCSSIGNFYLRPAPGGGNGTPNAILVPALPASAWIKDEGGINALCAPPNPSEALFQTTGFTAILACRSTTAQCCTCTRRYRSYSVPRMSTTTARIRGRFYAATTPSRYSQPSMRIELLLNGVTVGKRVYATQNRPNNNCVGPSEMPETILRSNANFDIRLSTIAAGQQFDQVRVHLLGYGCEFATNGVAVQNMILLPR